MRYELWADFAHTHFLKGWVDEQIEGFRIMLDRDVRFIKKLSIIFQNARLTFVPTFFFRFFFDLS